MSTAPGCGAAEEGAEGAMPTSAPTSVATIATRTTRRPRMPSPPASVDRPADYLRSAAMKSELFANTEVQSDAMFSLQNSKMLKITLNGSVTARQGAMVAYQGQADFNYQGAGGVGKMIKQKLSGEGVATMTVTGQAEVFFADQSRDVHLIYLEGDDAISINGRNVLAYDSALDVDVHFVGGAGMMAGGLFNTIIRGTGWVAITTHGTPVVLQTD